MKTSKSLTSAVVAVALAGAIGVAYAQGTTSNGASNGSNSSQIIDNVPTNPAMDAANSTGTVNSRSNMGSSNMGASNMATPTNNDTAAFSAERPAQADRN